MNQQHIELIPTVLATASSGPERSTSGNPNNSTEKPTSKKVKKKSNPSSTQYHRAAGRKPLSIWLEPDDYDVICEAAKAGFVPMTTFVREAAAKEAGLKDHKKRFGDHPNREADPNDSGIAKTGETSTNSSGPHETLSRQSKEWELADQPSAKTITTSKITVRLSVPQFPQSGPKSPPPKNLDGESTTEPENSAKRNDHKTPRTPVQLPRAVADVGKKLAKNRGQTFVDFLRDSILTQAVADCRQTQ